MLPDASLFRIGMLMIVATGVIQVVAQLVLSRAMDVLPSPPLSRYPRFYMMTHSVTAVVILMIGHILQVTMWALVYHDHWNEFVDLKSALYFSLASFTIAASLSQRRFWSISSQTKYINWRAASISVAMRARRKRVFWKSPIAWPNCRRSWA